MMKKLIIVLFGALIFSTSCFCWTPLTEEQKESAKRYYDVNKNMYFESVFNVEDICPNNGIAKFNLDFSILYGCETGEKFYKKIDLGIYKRVYKSIYEMWKEENNMIYGPETQKA